MENNNVCEDYIYTTIKRINLVKNLIAKYKCRTLTSDLADAIGMHLM